MKIFIVFELGSKRTPSEIYFNIKGFYARKEKKLLLSIYVLYKGSSRKNI